MAAAKCPARSTGVPGSLPSGPPLPPFRPETPPAGWQPLPSSGGGAAVAFGPGRSLARSPPPPSPLPGAADGGALCSPACHPQPQSRPGGPAAGSPSSSPSLPLVPRQGEAGGAVGPQGGPGGGAAAARQRLGVLWGGRQEGRPGWDGAPRLGKRARQAWRLPTERSVPAGLGQGWRGGGSSLPPLRRCCPLWPSKGRSGRVRRADGAFLPVVSARPSPAQQRLRAEREAGQKGLARGLRPQLRSSSRPVLKATTAGGGPCRG